MIQFNIHSPPYFRRPGVLFSDDAARRLELSADPAGHVVRRRARREVLDELAVPRHEELREEDGARLRRRAVVDAGDVGQEDTKLWLQRIAQPHHERIAGDDRAALIVVVDGVAVQHRQEPAIQRVGHGRQQGRKVLQLALPQAGRRMWQLVMLLMTAAALMQSVPGGLALADDGGAEVRGAPSGALLGQL